MYFNLGMEPTELNVKVMIATAEWCWQNKPEWNIEITDGGTALQSENSFDEDTIRQIQSFLGNKALQEAGKLGITLNV